MRLSCVLAVMLALGGCRPRHTRQARVAQPLPPFHPAAAAADSQGQERGQNRWKDTGVYVDGVPVGVLGFGELPVTLKPIWIEEQMSAEMRPHSNDPGYVIVKQRRYRFTDYLRALGIDLQKVKELHVAGPRWSETIVVSGADLRSKQARGFMFRFGGTVGGKAIPVVPNGFGNDMSPDKISAVMVYIHKKPPRVVPSEGYELDGQILQGVPYVKEPIHGGVRVYRDDKLVDSLHRRNVVEKEAAGVDGDGTAHYKLLDILKQDGVDVNGIEEAWIIRDERRKERLTAAQLAGVTFEMGGRKQNAIYIGSEKLQAQVLALHTKPLRADQLPVILPQESDD
jgi:hypothetical protein